MLLCIQEAMNAFSNLETDVFDSKHYIFTGLVSKSKKLINIRKIKQETLKIRGHATSGNHGQHFLVLPERKSVIKLATVMLQYWVNHTITLNWRMQPITTTRAGGKKKNSLHLDAKTNRNHLTWKVSILFRSGLFQFKKTLNTITRSYCMPLWVGGCTPTAQTFVV